MKKTLLIAIIALSMNAFAQNEQQTIQLQHFTFNPNEAERMSVLIHEMNFSDKMSEQNFEKYINNQKVQFRASSPILDSIYYWDWDTETAGWMLSSRTISIIYDANNNRTNGVDQNLDGDVWVNFKKTESSYDVNNNIITNFIQNWTGNSWENEGNYFYTYDANNNRTSMMYQNWNSNDWMNIVMFSYTYDANNNQLSGLNQKWSGEWVNVSQFVNTYDSNNNLLTELDQQWVLDSWENSKLMTNFYDEDNNTLSSVLQQNWYVNVWKDAYLSTYSYDANNNPTSILTQSWFNNVWYDIRLDTRTYDSNNNTTSILEQTWNGYEWENFLQNLASYNAMSFIENYSFKFWGTGQTDVTSGDSTHYFMQPAVGVNDLIVSEGNINVYPNPGTGKFTINSSDAINSVEVYNLLGKQVYSEQLSNQLSTAEIDISDFAKGIYFVKISDGKNTSTRKILVQ